MVVPLLLISLAISIGIVSLLNFLFPSAKSSSHHKEKKERKEESRSALTSTISHGKTSSAPSAPAASTSASTTAAAAAASTAAAPAATVTKAPKKKKPSKPKAAKKPTENKFESLAVSSAAEGDDEPSDDDSVASDAIIPSKAAQAALKKSKLDAKLAAEAKPRIDAEKEKEKERKEKEAAAAAAAAAAKAKKAAEAAAKKNKKAEQKKKAAAESAVGAKEAAVVAATETKDSSSSEAHIDVAPVTVDGWAVVEDKRKSKKKEEEENAAAGGASTVPEPAPEVKEEEDDEPVGPVIPVVAQEVIVDAQKLGVLIGPKGATKISIQQATGTIIQMPKAGKEVSGDVSITVSGPEEGVTKAVTALKELATQGFARLLVGEDFQESYVAVHPKYLPDIIGKSGSVIRALNNHTGVKITVPPSKPAGPDGKVPKVKVLLAGPKEKVSECRALIKELTKYYVTPITHPDQTYAELAIASNYFNYIIGSKGSEIKHIQNSYKVQVHIPDESSVNQNVLVVGEASNVEQAKKHIEKIIDRVNGIREQKEAEARENPVVPKEALPPKPVAPPAPGLTQQGGGKSTWANNGRNNNAAPAPQPPAEEEEAWTREFLPSAMAMDINAMLPAGAKYNAATAAVQPIGTLPAATLADKNPTPSGLPIEPKAPATSAWSNINAGQW